MKLFNAKIQQLNVLKGEIREKVLGLKARILPDSTIPKAEVTQITPYTGKWYKRISFRGTMEMVYIFYRFMYARVGAWLGVKAKAISAPAKTVEIDSKILSVEEAPLSSNEAAEIVANKAEKFTAVAKLVAYYRAAVVYISNILMGHSATLSAAPGASVQYQGEFHNEHTARADSAKVAIVESRYNRFTADSVAAGCAAPGEQTTAQEEFTAESTATADSAAAMGVNIQAATGTANAAKMATWMEPVVVDGVLILRQAYSATMNNDVLEVR